MFCIAFLLASCSFSLLGWRRQNQSKNSQDGLMVIVHKRHGLITIRRRDEDEFELPVVKIPVEVEQAKLRWEDEEEVSTTTMKNTTSSSRSIDHC
jgi:hypothetical protein